MMTLGIAIVAAVVAVVVGITQTGIAIVTLVAPVVTDGIPIAPTIALVGTPAVAGIMVIPVGILAVPTGVQVGIKIYQNPTIPNPKHITQLIPEP